MRIFAGLTIFIAGICFSAFPGNAFNAGWEYLFNGKDLDGWVQLNGKAKYEVKDNMIIGTAVLNTPNSFLCTKKHYGNFVLELEFKVNGDLNSGIQIRSNSFESFNNGRVHGYQVEIDPSDRSWSCGIYDEAGRGWLYDLRQNEAARKAFKKDDWNHYHIECIGTSLRTWINGIPAVNLIDDKVRSGFIGLQVHGIGNDKSKEGSSIMWRNIRILDLGTTTEFPQQIKTGDKEH
jgi:hypothetical protein